MYIVLRKFETDEKFEVCAAFDTELQADAEVEKQIRSGRQSISFTASAVHIAENGNHTWSL